MPKKILVIEDDPITRQLLTLIFTTAEYTVEAASNGFAGLKALQTARPDLVVLDLMLPGIDGFEVLNQIRHNPGTEDLPVIIVSAKTRQEDRDLGLRLGASAYLSKPYLPRELLQIVNDMLAGRPETTAPAVAPLLALVGPRATDTTNAALHLSVLLAQKAHAVTLIDPRPFSLEHPLMLELGPPAAPLTVPGLTANAAAGQRHPSGVRLWSNLEGQGDLGQLTEDDFAATLHAARNHATLVVLDMQLQPAEYWSALARLDAHVLIVTPASQAFLASIRSILTLLQRLKIPETRLGFLLVGATPADALVNLGPPILGRLPEAALTDDAALAPLTEQLLTWLKP